MVLASRGPVENPRCAGPAWVGKERNCPAAARIFSTPTCAPERGTGLSIPEPAASVVEGRDRWAGGVGDYSTRIHHGLYWSSMGTNMNANDELAPLVDALRAEFPSAPPEVVADQSWGDYGEAIDALRDHQGFWDRDTVFRHRSVLRFVNDPAFAYLIPSFVRAAYDHGLPEYNVLGALVSALKDRLLSRTGWLSPKQAAVLDAAISFLKEKSREDIGEDDRLNRDMNIILKRLKAISGL
jgi:hypothetical protein